MAGLRERKKEQTRQRIAEVALQLFLDRGFDAVTVNEIAAAAGVAKATLFAYFPTKESLVLHGVGGDDLAGIVAARPAGQSPLDALRAHFRSVAAGPVSLIDREQLVARIRLIFEHPVLSSAANGLLYLQRRALAEALAGEYGDRSGLTAALVAGQICASVLAVQEAFFQRLADGDSVAVAGRRMVRDVDRAFDLLANGIEPTRGN